MDCPDYITVEPERKRGAHLQREDRGSIERLHGMGYFGRAIARELGCSPSTVGNGLRRGTPPRNSNKGCVPSYSTKRGQAVYRPNRERCRKPHKMGECRSFVNWIVQQVRVHLWSLDAYVGYARLHMLFKEKEMVSTKALYNELWGTKIYFAHPYSSWERPVNERHNRLLCSLSYIQKELL